jgi:hypothetical protein
MKLTIEYFKKWWKAFREKEEKVKMLTCQYGPKLYLCQECFYTYYHPIGTDKDPMKMPWKD